MEKRINKVYFNVNVKISYKLQDVKKYYFQGQIEENAINQIVRESIIKQNKQWDVSQGWELQNSLENQIERKLYLHEGVEFKIIVEVIPDKAAMEIQESNRDKVVGWDIPADDQDHVQASVGKYQQEKELEDFYYRNFLLLISIGCF